MYAASTILFGNVCAQGPPVHTVAFTITHLIVAAADLDRTNRNIDGSIANPATTLDHGHIAVHSKRRLLEPITNTASLQSAVNVWCNNSAVAANIYGYISAWYVEINI